jgi:hypothetical protein
MEYITDKDVQAIIEHETLSDGDFQGFINDWGVPIDWDITEKNKWWHETFFTKRAIYDHQAKGNCRFAMNIIKEMGKQGWLRSGDVILDPMCGIGSFNIVAALSGYDSIGVEMEETFYKDMVGFDTRETVDEDDLFGSFLSHVEGTIERFLRLTESIPAVGDILIVQGDARNLNSALAGYEYPNKKARVLGGPVWNPLRQGHVVSSPPYGNRMRDEGQRFGSKDGKDWADMEGIRDYNKQYSYDDDNIGNAKIQIVCSPPYGRSTEHSEAQIESMDKPGSGFHGHKPFKYGKGNIAILADNKYSKEMFKVYKSMYGLLKPGAYIALITRNFIQDFKVVELDELTIKLMKRAGFEYIKTMRARLPELSLFKNINWEKYHKDKGLPKIDWEEVTFYVR